MSRLQIVVDGYVPTDGNTLKNLRDDVWSFAMDQRAFGPRRLLVAFAEADGTFRGLAYTARTDPPEIGLDACLTYMGGGAAAAIAFCDQSVSPGAPPDDFAELFERAREVSAAHGVYLVDWIACDDELMRANRVPMFSAGDSQAGAAWWDVPQS